MSTQTLPIKVENKSIPEPLPLEASTETYVLYFIQGNTHQMKQKNFVHTGNRRSAIARGKRHCEQMSYRFIRVEPFFSNLEEDERRHQD